jgi:hypothetical protein
MKERAATEEKRKERARPAKEIGGLVFSAL